MNLTPTSAAGCKPRIAKPCFPTTWFALFAVILLSSLAAAQTEIFNNISTVCSPYSAKPPNCGYFPIFGPTGDFAVPNLSDLGAVQFTPAANGVAGGAKVVVVQNAPGPGFGTSGGLSLAIYSDANGSPGTAISETVTGLSAPYCCAAAIVTGTFSKPVPLSAGTPYWLVLMPGASDTYVAWVVGGTTKVPVQQTLSGGTSCGWCTYAPSYVQFAIEGVPLQITTTSIPGIASGQAYVTLLNATGGTGSGYTWCVQSGSACVTSGTPLPEGFLLLSTGLLSSTRSPAALPGSYPLTVQVSDSGGNTATQSLSLVISCATPFTPYAFGKYMMAHFTPPAMPNNAHPSIFDYAPACGFTTFNWQQQWTVLPTGTALIPAKPFAIPGNVSPGSCAAVTSSLWPANNCFLVAGPSFLTDNTLSYPTLFDPPEGSYVNPNAPAGYDPYPFYYPPNEIQPGVTACTLPPKNGVAQCPFPFPFVLNQAGTTLSFLDAPSLSSLPGDSPSSFPLPGHYVSFQTSLVGVSNQVGPGSALCGSNSLLYCTTIYSWHWNSTFNGKAGGVSQSASFAPVDPDSGTGGVTITSVNGVPTPTVTVTPSAVNILTTQALTVTISVSGGSGSPTATGTVELSSGNYNSGGLVLSSGGATVNIPAGSLAVGTDTLMVVYTPDQAVATNLSTGYGFAEVAVTPQLSFSAPGIAFGNQLEGSYSAPQTLTVTNTSTGTLNLSGVSISGANVADFVTTSDCGATLALGKTCAVTITFRPTALGLRSAQIAVAVQGIGSPFVDPLSGTGIDVSITPIRPDRTTRATSSSSAGKTTVRPNVTKRGKQTRVRGWNREESE